MGAQRKARLTRDSESIFLRMEGLFMPLPWAKWHPIGKDYGIPDSWEPFIHLPIQSDNIHQVVGVARPKAGYQEMNETQAQQ